MQERHNSLAMTPHQRARSASSDGIVNVHRPGRFQHDFRASIQDEEAATNGASRATTVVRICSPRATLVIGAVCLCVLSFVHAINFISKVDGCVQCSSADNVMHALGRYHLGFTLLPALPGPGRRLGYRSRSTSLLTYWYTLTYSCIYFCRGFRRLTTRLAPSAQIFGGTHCAHMAVASFNSRTGQVWANCSSGEVAQMFSVAPCQDGPVLPAELSQGKQAAVLHQAHLFQKHCRDCAPMCASPVQTLPMSSSEGAAAGMSGPVDRPWEGTVVVRCCAVGNDDGLSSKQSKQVAGNSESTAFRLGRLDECSKFDTLPGVEKAPVPSNQDAAKEGRKPASTGKAMADVIVMQVSGLGRGGLGAKLSRTLRALHKKASMHTYDVVDMLHVSPVGNKLDNSWAAVAGIIPSDLPGAGGKQKLSDVCTPGVFDDSLVDAAPLLQTNGIRVGYTGLKQHAVGCAPFLDDLPHVWSVYKQNGYTTALFEDSCSSSLSFRRKPADFWLRREWCVVEGFGTEADLDDAIDCEQRGASAKTAESFKRFVVEHMKGAGMLRDDLHSGMSAGQQAPAENSNAQRQRLFAWLSVDAAGVDDDVLQQVDRILETTIRKVTAVRRSTKSASSPVIFLTSLTGSIVVENAMASVFENDQESSEAARPALIAAWPGQLSDEYPMLRAFLDASRGVVVSPFDFYETLAAVARHFPGSHASGSRGNHTVPDVKRIELAGAMDASTQATPRLFPARGVSLINVALRGTRPCSQAGISPQYCLSPNWQDVHPSSRIVSVCAKALYEHITAKGGWSHFLTACDKFSPSASPATNTKVWCPSSSLQTAALASASANAAEPKRSTSIPKIPAGPTTESAAQTVNGRCFVRAEISGQRASKMHAVVEVQAAFKYNEPDPGAATEAEIVAEATAIDISFLERIDARPCDCGQQGDDAVMCVCQTCKLD